jgi:glycerate 2-kinase
MFIKNFERLAKTPQRKIALELIETAFSSIQSENVINSSVKVEGDVLKVMDQTFNISNFERIFLIGFGKGSAKNSRLIEEKLGDKLTAGYVIDTNPEEFKKIQFVQGTHPLPSQTNVDFVNNLLNHLTNLSEKDLVLVVVTGGGSALFESPEKISFEKLVKIGDELLKSGANITEMNTVRKHLSKVKGGGLAKRLYPATIVGIIASDVPGNDLSVISSGPAVKDKTTIDDAIGIISKYSIDGVSKDDLIETPKEDKYFEKVHNILILSNRTALEAMKKKAEELGQKAEILDDKFQSEAKEAGKILMEKTPAGTIGLFGGETTVKVKGEGGKGGRSQELVLASLPLLDEPTLITSFDSDGWDNSHFAGAIGDGQTLEKAKELNLNPQDFLEKSNSLEFFEKVEDGIETGRLPSNVSDLMIVFKS